MQTSAEAPAKEPQILTAAEPIELRRVAHGFGDLEVLAGLDSMPPPARSSGSSGPPGAASRPCSS